MNWLKYSGATISLTLNPFHWGFQCKNNNSIDIWDQDYFLLQVGPLSLRVWISDGSW